MENIDFNNQTDLKELWNRILDEFKDINQNYQQIWVKKIIIIELDILFHD